MQGIEYNVDVVMCIDVTGSMHGILETVKTNALKFSGDLQKSLEEKDKHIDELRVKVIAYRDFGFDAEYALEETDFLVLPEQESEFNSFVHSLEPGGGGDEPENGLEALSLAMQSDWTKKGDKRRQIIVVYSDASTHPMDHEISKSASNYPANMPADFNELTDQWDGQSGTMSMAAKRLLLFVPDSASWTDIGTHWNNTIHYPSQAGKGLEEVDYETILSAIVNSI